MKVLLACVFLAININYSNAQSIDDKIDAANAELARISEQKKAVEGKIEGLNAVDALDNGEAASSRVASALEIGSTPGD